MSITMIYYAMSLTIVSVTLRRGIRISQWFIMVCLTTLSVSLRRVIGLSQWFIMLCLCLYCISITKKGDMYITVIYHGMSLTVLYQYHQEEWYVYHSDLSWYVSDCTVSVSLRRVIHLSQWFIMVCLWLYCISITKKSDRSITVIYHGMSLTVLYQYH